MEAETFQNGEKCQGEQSERTAAIGNQNTCINHSNFPVSPGNTLFKMPTAYWDFLPWSSPSFENLN